MKIGFRLKLFLFTAIVIGITSLATAYLPYHESRMRLEKQLAKELMSVVGTAAIFIDGDAHENIFMDPEFGLEGQQEFDEIREMLIEIANINRFLHHRGLSPIYTLRPAFNEADEELVEFVVMTNKNLQGRYFSGATIEKIPIHDVVLNGESAHTPIYEDSEGLWITAAAPLRSRDGTVVGIIQADRPVEFYQDNLANIRKLYIFGGFTGILAGLAMSIIFSSRVIKPIQQLLLACRTFSKGDFSSRIAEKRGDEFGELFHSFDDMANSVYQANRELKARAEDLQSTALFALLNPAPVIRVTEDGKIDRANKPANRLLLSAYDSDSLCAEDIFIELNPQNLKDIIENDKLIQLSLECQSRWFQFSVIGVSKYKFANIYGADVTKRITAEKTAKEAQLEAEGASRAKSLFLATMSHELRTPMNAIIGFTGLACRQELKPTIRNYLQKVSGASKSLLELINNILDFSKIDSGNMEIESLEFDFREAIHEALDLFTNLSKEKGIDLFLKIDDEIPSHIVGDPLRIKQILINLINNALKFTEKGAIAVKIKLNILTKHVHFDVIDSGIGIDKDKTKTLFTPFVQADNSTTRRYGGTGLGLSISQRLARYMDGDLQVESIPGRGSRFYFSFPLTNATESAPYYSHVNTQGCIGKTFLFIDDCNISIVFMDEFIQSIGARIVHSRSLDDALTQYPLAYRDQTTIDAVIFNARADQSNLDNLCKTVSPIFASVELPVLFFHPSSTEELNLPVNKNCYGLLEKPFKQNELYLALESLWHCDRAEIAEADDFEEFLDEEDALQASPNLAGFSVLIAEDDPVNQELALELMNDLAMDFQIVSNGLEAFEALSEKNFDAVLMDMQMPIMDGYSATRMIRKEEKWAKLPIIAVTANALAGDAEKCLQAGVSDYLSKPIDYSQLYAVLKKWLPEA